MERKRPNESYESFAERQIRSAQSDGEFDNLPGFGKPIPGIDAPLEEDWWLKRKLKSEQLSALPPILEARRTVEKELSKLAQHGSERAVRRLVERLNKIIREAHYSPIPGPPDGLTELDADSVVAQWRQARTEK